MQPGDRRASPTTWRRTCSSRSTFSGFALTDTWTTINVTSDSSVYDKKPAGPQCRVSPVGRASGTIFSPREAFLQCLGGRPRGTRFCGRIGARLLARISYDGGVDL